MRATLDFDLNDPEDARELHLALKATDFQCCFFEIIEFFRKEFRYSKHPPEISEYIEKIRNELYQIIEKAKLTDHIM